MEALHSLFKLHILSRSAKLKYCYLIFERPKKTHGASGILAGKQKARRKHWCTHFNASKALCMSGMSVCAACLNILYERKISI